MVPGGLWPGKGEGDGHPAPAEGLARGGKDEPGVKDGGLWTSRSTGPVPAWAVLRRAALSAILRLRDADREADLPEMSMEDEEELRDRDLFFFFFLLRDRDCFRALAISSREDSPPPPTLAGGVCSTC